MSNVLQHFSFQSQYYQVLQSTATLKTFEVFMFTMAYKTNSFLKAGNFCEERLTQCRNS